MQIRERAVESLVAGIPPSFLPSFLLACNRSFIEITLSMQFTSPVAEHADRAFFVKSYLDFKLYDYFRMKSDQSDLHTAVPMSSRHYKDIAAIARPVDSRAT